MIRAWSIHDWLASSAGKRWLVDGTAEEIWRFLNSPLSEREYDAIEEAVRNSAPDRLDTFLPVIRFNRGDTTFLSRAWRNAAATVAASQYPSLARILKGHSEKSELTLSTPDGEIVTSTEEAAELTELLRLESKQEASTLPIKLEDVELQKPPESRSTSRHPRSSGAALVLDSTAVCIAARRRIAITWWLYLLQAIGMWGLFAVTLIGSAASWLYWKEPLWGTVLGGASLADVVGLLVVKPTAAFRSVNAESQLFDAAWLELELQLKTCADYRTLKRRLSCVQQAWDRFHQRLNSDA